MTVKQLLANADSEEISGWIAYENVKEPSESWHQIAGQNHLIASLMLGKKAPAYSSYLPKNRRPKPRKKVSKSSFLTAIGAVPVAKKTPRQITVETPDG